MKPRSIVIFLAALLIWLFVAPPLLAADFCNESFQVVLNEQNSGITQPEQRVIDNEDDWCAFWDRVYSMVFPRPECDREVIDFEKEVAIVAGIGARPNSCYAVAVTCVHRFLATDQLAVILLESQPGEGCSCMPTLVHPVEVVKVDRPVHGAVFSSVPVMIDCP